MIRQYGMMIDHGEYNDDPTIRHDDRIMICEAGLYLSIYIHVAFLSNGGATKFFSTRWGGVGWGWVQEVRSDEDDERMCVNFSRMVATSRLTHARCVNLIQGTYH